MNVGSTDRMASRRHRTAGWASAAMVTVLALGCAAPALADGSGQTKGLVSRYQANGNAQDTVGHNNGTIHGGVTYAAGHPGRAFSFNGRNGYISVGNAADLHDSGGFAINAEVRFNSLARPSGSTSKPCNAGRTACDMSIVSKMVPPSNGTPNTNGWRLLKQLDNHFWFCLGADGNGCSPGSGTTARSKLVARPHVWYDVTGVYSSKHGLALYVDGKKQGTASGVGAVDTDVAPMLFGYYERESFLYGRLDSIEYFDRALSSAQVRALAKGGK